VRHRETQQLTVAFREGEGAGGVKINPGEKASPAAGLR